jgi:hypothetical protein
MPTQTPRPTPDRIFQSLNAYQLSAALKAAIELDVFGAIGAGENTAAAIASRRYALAPDAAAFLNRQSPTYLGSCANFLASSLQQGEFRKLADAVRKGGTVMGSEGSLAPAIETFVRKVHEALKPGGRYFDKVNRVSFF